MQEQEYWTWKRTSEPTYTFEKGCGKYQLATCFTANKVVFFFIFGQCTENSARVQTSAAHMHSLFLFIIGELNLTTASSSCCFWARSCYERDSSCLLMLWVCTRMVGGLAGRNGACETADSLVFPRHRNCRVLDYAFFAVGHERHRHRVP